MLENLSTQNQTLSLSIQLKTIFNHSQHVSNSNSALTQIKRIYKNTPYKEFEAPFKDCIRKLLQSEDRNRSYFKVSCDFVCEFLSHVSKLSDEAKAAQSTVENVKPGVKQPTRKTAPRTNAGTSKRNKRRKTDDSDDELIPKTFTDSSMINDQDDEDIDEISMITEPTTRRNNRRSTSSQLPFTVINDHDRIISSFVALLAVYVSSRDESCRLNAVSLLDKFLAKIQSLDEDICTEIKMILLQRFRDRKATVRAHAFSAAREFQESRSIRDAFIYHFQNEPELMVRKSLMHVMKPEIFGYEFLVDSTQDASESMRKNAFSRLSTIDPHTLNQKQLHRVIHNGIVERDHGASYAFKNATLRLWLPKLYPDGLDLYKLLELFDVMEYTSDVEKFLDLIHDQILSSGSPTQIHKVVEHFREKWLTPEKTLSLNDNKINEKIVIIWFSLIKFCKANRTTIKSVKLKVVPNEKDDTIEKILDLQERDEDIIDLYETIEPDLLNLVKFVNRFIHFTSNKINQQISKKDITKYEFIYHQLMRFTLEYEIGDELERKLVQETLDTTLKEDLLTGTFNFFIPPIIKSLYHLIYSKNSKMMIDYIAEIIQNVRSHLEDIASSSVVVSQRRSIPVLCPPSSIKAPSSKGRLGTTKKVRIQEVEEVDDSNLHYKIAKLRVELECHKDDLDRFIRQKDFDQAKEANEKMSDIQAKISNLQDVRLNPGVSNISRMSVIGDTVERGIEDKMSSTMISPGNLDDSNSSFHSNHSNDEVKIFRNHPSELLKCLQMYYGCMQSVKVDQVPHTMLNHLRYLNFECLDDTFKTNPQIRSLMVECNGLTAFLDKEYANDPHCIDLFIAACYDPNLIELRASGYKSLTDVVCQHEDIIFPAEKLEKFLKSTLRVYGKYDPNDMTKSEFDFLTVLVEGTAKLFYVKKISSPEILAHLILWWYHPRTPSKLKQFIGLFLPIFVNDLSQRERNQDKDPDYLQNLLRETFLTSIEYLHDYIRGPGKPVMGAGDMGSLMNFLCNLVPPSHIRAIQARIDQRIDDMSSTASNKILTKYLNQAKMNLNSQLAIARTQEDLVNESTPLLTKPLNLFD